MSAPLDPLVVKLVSEINTPYTSCYCEENIYLACQHLLVSASRCLQDVYAVFISNTTQTVMIWEQRASQYGPELGSPVVWDYHVIMILVAAVDDNNDTHPTMAERTYVVDFDSTLGTLSSWKDYTSRTFRSDLFKAGIFDTQLQSMFRIISATRFIDQFASDRSHMMETSEEGVVEFKMPPPVYEPIVGPGAKIGRAHV